jgi:hypothetical protein
MGRFTIEVSENLVEVRTEEVKPRLTVSFVLTILLCVAGGVYFWARALSELTSLITTASRFDIWQWLPSIIFLFVGSAFIWRAFRSMFPSGESLVCDAATLTIGRIPENVLTGRWTYQSFPTKSVKQLAFGVVRINRYGGTPGLVFEVDGKKEKTLFGLEAPEANEILQGLSRLGVNTVHDPAMPMMVEMVQSRRKSRLGRLL